MLGIRKRNAYLSFQASITLALLASIGLIFLLVSGSRTRTTLRKNSTQRGPIIQLLAAAGLREPIEEIAKQYEAECGGLVGELGRAMAFEPRILLLEDNRTPFSNSEVQVK